MFPNMYFKLNEDGSVSPCKDFGEFCKTHQLGTQIALTTVAKNVTVSTIFLGINCSPGSEGPPILFETMAFGDTVDNLARDRYATKEEALRGHGEMVTRVTNGLKEKKRADS